MGSVHASNQISELLELECSARNGLWGVFTLRLRWTICRARHTQL